MTNVYPHLPNQAKATHATTYGVRACNLAIMDSKPGKLPRWAITAKPYLKAIRDADYGMENPKMCVRYALSNMASWRGEEARQIKQLLKEAIK